MNPHNALFAVPFLLLFSTASALDLSDPEADLLGFCSENATFSGIEDVDEKRQFIASCMESYGGKMDNPAVAE